VYNQFVTIAKVMNDSHMLVIDSSPMPIIDSSHMLVIVFEYVKPQMNDVVNMLLKNDSYMTIPIALR
jgi:hypothetical protein